MSEEEIRNVNADPEEAAPEAGKPKKEKKSVGAEILSWVLTLLTAVVAAPSCLSPSAWTAPA